LKFKLKLNIKINLLNKLNFFKFNAKENTVLSNKNKLLILKKFINNNLAKQKLN